MAFLVHMLFVIMCLNKAVSADCLGKMLGQRREVQYLVDEANAGVEELVQAHADPDVYRLHDSEHMLSHMFYKGIDLEFKTLLLSRTETFIQSIADFGCAYYGTTLAEIQSEYEFKELAEIVYTLDNYNCLFIALYDLEGNGVWEHSKGKKAHYTRFAEEQPEHVKGKKHCAVMSRQSEWKMKISNCTLEMYCHFVCEMR